MTGSFTLRVSLIVLSALLSAAFLYAVRWSDRQAHCTPGRTPLLGRSSLVFGVWLLATGVAGGMGVLSFETRPPTMLLMLAAGGALTVGTAFSRLGTQLATALPLSVLVGFQAFRIPVELWLHRGYLEGVFPVQMTYAGFNFDIVSGMSAVIVAAIIWKGRAPTPLVMGWNVLGTALLATIVAIAILSAPLPIRVFTEGPTNVWVTGFPGVWLPAVLVQAALLGHLLVFRKLASEYKRASMPEVSPSST